MRKCSAAAVPGSMEDLLKPAERSMNAISDGTWLRHCPGVVVLSPHCDDAAFSLAGLLNYCRDRDKPTSVINVFSYSSYAPRLLFKTSVRVTRIRKQEDAAFATLLKDSCRMVWLDQPDAALRKDYRHRDVCTPCPLSISDLRLVVEVADYLRTQLSRDHAVMIPLGLGFHVDHQIVREAGLSLVAEGFSSLYLYEDLPYAALYPLEILAAWIRDFSRARRVHLDPYCLSVADLIAWKRCALHCYPSQTSPRVFERILGHARRLNPAGAAIERFWRLSFCPSRSALYESVS